MWLGQTLSLIGSSVARFAIIWWITEQTGLATTLTTLALVIFIPGILLGPVVGALVDRWNRKLTMIVADALSALAIAVLAWLLWIDSLAIWHIYVIAFVNALGSMFHSAAMIASTSLMVPEKHLARVQGINQAISGLLTIAGPLLGALALAFLPLYAIMGIDVITAVLAIAVLLFIHVPQPMQHRKDEQPTSVATDVRSGVLYIWQWRGLFLIILSATIANMFMNPVMTLLPILITQHFHGNATELAWLQASLGIGILSGGLLLGIWGGFQQKTLMLPISLTGMGLSALLIGFTPASMFWMACAGILCFGILNSLLNGTLIAMLQSAITPEMQGRVFSVLGSGSQAAVPIGLLIAGPVVDAIGAPIWFVIAGMVVLVIGVLIPLIPSVMKLEESVPPEQS